MKLISKQDIIIIAAVAACAIALTAVLLFMPKGGYAVIEYDGNTVVYDLSSDGEYVFESRGYTLIVEIKDGKVRVKEADCPDRICVGTGAISKSGSAIVCVPAGFSIRAVTEYGGADFVAG